MARASSPLRSHWLAITATAFCAACGPTDDPPEGTLQAGAVIGEQPVIEDVTVSPGTFLTACDTATLEASVSENTLGPIAFSWAVDDAPMGASFNLAETSASAVSSTATFTTDRSGPYELVVQADDGAHAPFGLPLRLHVSPCP